jgi:hypothetical protein
VAGDKHIITPEETAQYLNKSLSWVYKNADLLGAMKLGGSLFFPAKEDLYERIFCQRKGMEVRLHLRAAFNFGITKILISNDPTEKMGFFPGRQEGQVRSSELRHRQDYRSSRQ